MVLIQAKPRSISFFLQVFFGDEVSHPIEKAQLETERGRENSITELHQESGLKSPAGKFDPTVKPHEDLKRQMSESLLQKRKSISEEQLKMKKGMAKSNLDFAKLTAKGYDQPQLLIFTKKDFDQMQ